MFCVECGKDAKLYEHLCKECFLKKNIFVKIPEYIDIVVCLDCRRVEIKNKWSSFENFEAAIKEKVDNSLLVSDKVKNCSTKLELNYRDDKNIDTKIIADISSYDLKLREEHRTRIRVKNGLCPKCSKARGKYYEGIIQVRATKRLLSTEEIEEIQNLINTTLENIWNDKKEVFVGKKEFVKGGLDYYISDNTTAREIAKAVGKIFGSSVVESPKLYGKKNGKEVYRVTFLVRLPKYKVDDIILYKDRIYQIIRFDRKVVYLTDLHVGEKIPLNRADLEKTAIIGGSELIKEAIVVSESKNEIQILDPETYKTITLIKPSHFIRKGEIVKIIKCEQGVFLISN